MEMLNKKQFWKFCQFLAPICFIFIFFTQGLESNYEKASDKLVAVEFINAAIEDHTIFEQRGFKTDEITINNEKYLINQDTLPNILIENIMDYSVSKTANSKEIRFSTKENSLTYRLWTYDKFKYWRNRIAFSLFGSLFFLSIGYLNLKLGK